MDRVWNDGEVGRLAEARFFRIVRPGRLAPWVKEIQRATPEQDARGVDAIVIIESWANRERLVRVPIQIKHSRGGVNEHLKAHKDHWWAGVVYVIVNNDIRDWQLLSTLREELLQVHRRGYDFEKFFTAIAAAPVPAAILTRIAADAERYLPKVGAQRRGTASGHAA